MRRWLQAAVVFGISAAVVGCGGEQKLRTQGRLLKGGQAFVPADGELLQITFVPLLAPGKLVHDFYYADVDQTAGTFRPAGKDGKGMPPGKYRVAVELMKQRKDQFKGKFDTVNSPFMYEVTATTTEIIIDLDQPPTG